MSDCAPKDTLKDSTVYLSRRTPPTDCLTATRLSSNGVASQPRSLPEVGWTQIATTGRLVEKKGIEYVIRAIALLLPTYPRLRYKIIAEGELRDRFTASIEELNLTENNVTVRFTIHR